jgi:hypothetical protein
MKFTRTLDMLIPIAIAVALAVALIAILVGDALYLGARRARIYSPLTCFLLGFGGFGVGYFVNQLVVCHTLIWGSPLSLPIH